MTKRELIDQILTENGTAEPGFLAQFSDEQLHEYLTHLKWLKQPRLRGDASRFDRYFRSVSSAASPPAHWRAARDAQEPSPDEAMDLSAPSEAFPEEAPEPPPSRAAAPPLPPEPSAPPQMQYVDFDASLPAEAEDLEAMQLSVHERTVLTPPTEEFGEAEEPPAEPDLSPEPELRAELDLQAEPDVRPEADLQARPAPPAAQPPPTSIVADDQTWLF